MAGERIERQARALWAEIAPGLGYDREGRWSLMKLKSAPGQERGVLSVTTPTGDRLVLKLVVSPRDPDGFARRIAIQRQLSDRMSPIEGLFAPEVLWADAERQAVVMAYVPGPSLRRALDYADFGLGARQDLLHRSGRLARCLHGPSVTTRPFYPKRHLARVRRIAEDLRADRPLEGPLEGPLDRPLEGRGLFRPRRFLGLCAYLHRAGRRVAGQQAAFGFVHGDLHPVNVLDAPEGLCVLDFTALQDGFQAVDLACFWNRGSASLDPEEGAARGYGGFAAADVTAFEEGYGRRISADPAFEFCFALRLFDDWLRLGPPERAEANRPELLRLVSRADWLQDKEQRGA